MSLKKGTLAETIGRTSEFIQQDNIKSKVCLIPAFMKIKDSALESKCKLVHLPGVQVQENILQRKEIYKTHPALLSQ